MASRRDDRLGWLVLVGIGIIFFVDKWIWDNPIAAAVIGVVALAIGFVIYKLHLTQQDQVLIIAEDVIRKHAAELARKRSQTSIRGGYNEWNFDRWFKEQDYFYEFILVQALPGSEHLETRLKYKSNTKLRGVCFSLMEKILDQTEVGATSVSVDSIVDPLEFERWCANTLEKQGWSARTTKGSGDQGADVIAERSGKRVVFQCKLYTNDVGNKAVQEAHAAREFEGADLGCVITNAGYTSSARALANRTNILLLHPDDLTNFDGPIGELDKRFSSFFTEESFESPDETVEEAFKRESKVAQDIQTSRPQFWEFLLVQELLVSRRSLLDAELSAMKSAASLRRSKKMNLTDYSQFIHEMLSDLADGCSDVCSYVEQDLPEALGVPGVSGDPIKILLSVQSITEVCCKIVEFERELNSLTAPSIMESMHRSMGGVGSTAVGFFEDFTKQWINAVNGLKDGTRDFNVNVILSCRKLRGRLTNSLQLATFLMHL